MPVSPVDPSRPGRRPHPKSAYIKALLTHLSLIHPIHSLMVRSVGLAVDRFNLI